MVTGATPLSPESRIVRFICAQPLSLAAWIRRSDQRIHSPENATVFVTVPHSTTKYADRAMARFMDRRYDKDKKRLIYIGQKASPTMWDEYWRLDSCNIRDVLRKTDKTITRITAKYLHPHDGVIVEGGCGTGRKVKSLMQAGYTVIGVDSAPRTVKMLNRFAPELDIRLADVRNLPLPHKSVAGYWSLGVIEHFYEGFDEIAKEIKRVIKPGGYLFLSFPYMSPIRRLKSYFHLYKEHGSLEKPQAFYQFVLTLDPVIETFSSYGFSLCTFKKKCGLVGFNDELLFPPFVALHGYAGNSKILRGFRYCLNCFLTPVFGHSCLIVFRARTSSSNN